jgi:L-asparaginase II
MTDLTVAAIRGPLAENVHRVHAAVVSADDALIAWSGDPGYRTFWRSAAKPFQCYPLIAEGGVERFGLDREMIALACGSHNGEPAHRAVAQRWLDRLGLSEADLACGGHLSLAPELARASLRAGESPTPLWSNCSGKHAGLLALARLHDWPTAGYEARGHPVFERVEASIARWTGLPPEELAWGVDGCTAAAVALPVEAMARAYGRLGRTADPAMRRIREAMLAEPMMIAGTGRLDTILMEAWAGRVIVKVGADGVYSGTLPSLGLGLAFKVEDGDGQAAGVALAALLEAVILRFDPDGDWPFDALARWRRPDLLDTRSHPIGHCEAQGSLQFLS